MTWITVITAFDASWGAFAPAILNINPNSLAYIIYKGAFPYLKLNHNLFSLGHFVAINIYRL